MFYARGFDCCVILVGAVWLVGVVGVGCLVGKLDCRLI